MSCEHIDYVLEHSRQRGSCLLVLVIIAFYSDQNGEWTTDQATLQRLARLGRRRIQQILRKLAKSGELAVVSHFGRGKLSTYRLLVGEECSSRSALRFPSHQWKGGRWERGQGVRSPRKSDLERWMVQPPPDHRTAISIRMRDLQRISRIDLFGGLVLLGAV